jgi:peptidylprolyl isomerase
LKYVDEVVGTGSSPKAGRNVTVSYVGTFKDGRKFDASADHGGTYSFVIGQGTVIKGWDEGVMTMKVGGKRILYVPAALAYGARGNGPIPPNTDLVFEVQLISVQQ